MNDSKAACRARRWPRSSRTPRQMPSFRNIPPPTASPDRVSVPRRPARRRPTQNDPTDDVVSPHRLQPLPRYAGLPGRQAAVGHSQRHRFEQGTIAWRCRVGEFPELTKRGVKRRHRELRRPVVTAGGLVFIGATKDEKIRAFDAASGRTLWEAPLPAAAHATPRLRRRASSTSSSPPVAAKARSPATPTASPCVPAAVARLRVVGAGVRASLPARRRHRQRRSAPEICRQRR